MVMKKIKEKLLESSEGLTVLALTALGVAILFFFGIFKTYPPSAFLAAFTVMAGVVLLIPLVLRLAREEEQ